MSLAVLALGVALGDVDNGVHEEGGNNAGPRIRKYLKNVDPPINQAAPWCAAALQRWADVAAQSWDVPNPLDAVRLEAYVQSYHDWAKANNKIVLPSAAQPGDLILYKFGGQRFDHIGIVLRRLKDGMIAAVEGNTSPGVGASTEERERDGDGVYIKVRIATRQPIAVVRWA